VARVPGEAEVDRSVGALPEHAAAPPDHPLAVAVCGVSSGGGAVERDEMMMGPTLNPHKENRWDIFGA